MSKSASASTVGTAVILFGVLALLYGIQLNESQEAAVATIEAFGGQVSLANSEARKRLEAAEKRRANTNAQSTNAP